MRIKFDPHKKCKRTRMGILWKMLVIILVFILAFSFAMWIFQMQMLNYSYQGAKYRELDKTVEKIKEQNNLPFHNFIRLISNFDTSKERMIDKKSLSK